LNIADGSTLAGRPHGWDAPSSCDWTAPALGTLATFTVIIRPAARLCI